MRQPPPAEPVKRLAAVLWSRADAIEKALESLWSCWGPIDHLGADRHFDTTDYYEREMGTGLLKRIVSFERLVEPESLADAKLACIELEESLRGPAGRLVNLDPGYMDVHKVVLASIKPAAQKICVGKGVHADMVLRYSRGRFHPFEWTFADFRDGRYEPDLLAIRALYRSRAPLQSSSWPP